MVVAMDNCFAHTGTHTDKGVFRGFITTEASPKHCFKRQLHRRQVVPSCWLATVLPRRAYGDGIRKIVLCAQKSL